MKRILVQVLNSLMMEQQWDLMETALIKLNGVFQITL